MNNHADQVLQAKVKELADLLEWSKQQIANARVERAIRKLLEYDKEIDPELKLIQFSQQWKDVTNQDDLGLIDFSTASTRKNQIVHGLLKHINAVEEEYVEGKGLIAKTQIEAPTIPPTINVEKITGKGGNLYEMDWIAKMVEASRSVCRIVTKESVNGQTKTFYGTGFLLEGGYLVTNHHVLHSRAAVEGSIAEFGYTNQAAKATYRLDVDSWKADKDLDVARVKLIDDQEVSLSHWGFLKVNPDYAIQSNHTALNIIQHPEGEPMKVAFTENEAIRVTDVLIDYKTDTLEGSSGSPVLNQDWEVVGVHRGAHSDKNANAGTPIKAALAFFEGGSSPTNSDGGPGNNERAAAGTGGSPDPVVDSGRFKILFLYAQEDTAVRDKLNKHFFLLRRNEQLQFLDIHDDVPPTADEYAAQEAMVRSADLVLCLISDNILTIPAYPLAELALEGSKLIPLRINEIDLSGTIFEPIKGLPSNNLFVSQWSSENSAFVDIAKNLKKHLEKRLAG